MESKLRRIAEFPVGSWLREFFRPRYAALGLSLFLAMYVGLKFILVVFNAADASERWSFELTPFAALNLPDVQLAFLAGVAAVSNAFLHYSVERRHRLWATLLTGFMVVGLLLALRVAPADFDSVNLGRVAALVMLLAIVPLDNIDFLRTTAKPQEDFIESELRSIAESQPATRLVSPAAAMQALRELEALVAALPETEPTPAPPEPASAGTADDEYLRGLMTSLLGESEADEELPKPAEPSVREPTPPAVPVWEEPMVANETGKTRQVGRHRGRLARSPAVLLEEARALMDQGKPEKALKRLDRAAARDVHYPGLWELAAEVYERLGEPEVAAECRRRVKESP